MSSSSIHLIIISSFIVIFTCVSQVSLGGSKPESCQKPVVWGVDENGVTVEDVQTESNSSIRFPMQELFGNVTLVALFKTSPPSLIQASRMKDMIKRLELNGLTDIRIVIITSKYSTDEQRNELLSRINGSSIQVFQEAEESNLWERLGGTRDDRGTDVFMYDRCGRVTYYLPHPLSVVSGRTPIVQTTILSTYFDYPCGSVCEERRIQVTTEAPLPSTTGDEQKVMNISLNASEIATNAVNKSLEEPEYGNGDGMFQPWKIFDFFLNQMNRLESTTPVITLNDTVVESFTNTTSSVKEEVIDTLSSLEDATTTQQYNLSLRSLNGTQVQTELTTVFSDETSGDEASITTISPVATTSNSSSPSLAVVQCDANQCRSFSTDYVLLARLCCLREVDDDGESTLGCRTFSKTTCNQMLPLIKCCLKDFKELLSNYFSSQTNNGRRRTPTYVG